MSESGPLELLIFQGTPFCNIDCSYCYLPDRNNRARIEIKTVEKAAQRIVAEGLLGRELEVLWHCGEPLVLPLRLYSDFFTSLSGYLGQLTQLRFAIQTNATLLTPEWCRFLKHWNVQVGVSIDGPESIHDLYRRDRRGRGTHAAVMRGIDQLLEHEIKFSVICVLHKESLTQAAEIHDFFVGAGVKRVCFNVEEIEGINASSSLQFSNGMALTEQFFVEYFRILESGGGKHWVREYDHSLRAIFSKRFHNATVTPYQILSVDHRGDYCTFSPELLGMRDSTGEPITLANIFDTQISFASALATKAALIEGIARGIEACRASCTYFEMCGGGSPSSKLAEHKRLDATETVYCRFGTQAPLNAMAVHLQSRARGFASDSVPDHWDSHQLV